MLITGPALPSSVNEAAVAVTVPVKVGVILDPAIAALLEISALTILPSII